MNAKFYPAIAGRLIPAILIFAFPYMPVQAEILTVCPSGCSYSAVETAINAAVSGDTVQLANGSYKVNLDIDKDILVRGQDADKTLLDGSSQHPVIKVNTNAKVELHQLTIRNGMSAQGGGGIVNKGQLKLTKCLITDNKATQENGFGGGIYNQGELVIENSTISRNTASLAGGAIYNVGKLVQIANSAVINNLTTAPLSTGGIYSKAPSGSKFNILQTTISGNNGTAIYNLQGADVLLRNVTVKMASEGQAAIVSSGGVIHMGSSIIETLPGSPNCSLLGMPVATINSSGANITSDASCLLNDPADQMNNSQINLGPLKVNDPGTTATHPLLPGSAAIDTSTGKTCPDALLDHDQRYIARPQGLGCDSGAYEVRMPVANDDVYVTKQDQVISSPQSLLANDISESGLHLMLDSVSSVTNGANFYVYTTGGFQYTPPPGFIGEETFTYTVTDGIHRSNKAKVTIRIQP